jgi:hypothetical protein
MKKIVLSLIIVILIFIVGCGQQDQQTQQDIYSGTKGITMKFLPNTPPSEVFENSELIVLVEYSNEGAYDVSRGALYLTGYDQSYLFGSGSIEKSFSSSYGALRGKSIMFPEGETRIAQFQTTAGKPQHIDKFTQRLKLTACYDYKTLATAQVCIDPEAYSQGGGTKICTPGVVTLSGGQGAPIAVTKIDERIAGNMAYFDIHFRNMGSGEVFVGNPSHCYTSIGYNELNRIKVNSVRLSNSGNIYCEPNIGSNVVLTNGEGFIKCYANIPRSGDEYLTNLDIELVYSYRESSPLKTINILSAPGGSSSSSTRSSSSTSSSSSSGSSGSGICGDKCAAAVGHADAPWCYCSNTGSCPSGYRSLGNSADGCTPCCVKS